MRSLQGFPWLAHVYADYFRLNDLAMASHLEQKSHPARKAAEHAREVAEKRRIAEKLWRVLKYQLEYYETDAFTLAHHPRLRRASGAHRIDGVGKPLALALHALPAGNLTFAGGIERSVANLDLTLSLVMADDQAIWRDADLVSLNECGAEPSANSFLPPPRTTGTVKMLIASTRSLASSAWTSSVLPWVTRFGPSSCFRRFTSAMSRRSTEPAQLVSTSPERETAYFLMSLNSLVMRPWERVRPDRASTRRKSRRSCGRAGGRMSP